MDHIRNKFTSLVSSLKTEVVKLQDDRKTLAKDIDELQKEHDKLNVSPYKIDTKRVKLEVGGQFFSSTLETLTKVPDSLLGRMFSGRYPLEFTPEGRIFIDRDGSHFRHILNYLRDPENWKMGMKDKQTIDELRTESRFYGLEDPMFKKNNRSPTRQGWLDGKVRVNGFSSQYESCPATNILDPQKKILAF